MRKILLPLNSGKFAVFLLSAVFFAGAFTLVRGGEHYAKAAYYNSIAIKTLEDPTVYILQNQFYKLALPSEKIFLSYGFNWEDIKIVSAAEMSLYKNTTYIRLVNSKSLYRLDSGGNKRLLNSDAQNFLSLSSNNALVVSRLHFNFFQTGLVLTKSEAEKDMQNFFVGPILVQGSQSEECVPDETVGGKFGCLVYEAYVKNDVSLCEKIYDDKWQSLCLSSFMPSGSDKFSNCKKIADENYRQDCYIAVAVTEKKSSYCSLLTSEQKKSLCLMNVGIALKDFNACNYASVNERDKCYFSYALINLETQACDNIANTSEFKQNCLKFSSQAQ